MCALVEGMLAARGIGFVSNARVQAVEGREVVLEGRRLAYDLLLAVAPHRAPAVVKEAGLAFGEWVRPDKHTCEVPDSFNVFAVGDITEVPLANGLSLPKAGVFAEAQGLAAADAIADRLAPPGEAGGFDGQGYCYMETGGGKATRVQGEFFAAPAPVVRVAPPAEGTLAEKQAFESSRLGRWF
jgi:sulfide:quinone oxidoreductase